MSDKPSERSAHLAATSAQLESSYAAMAQEESREAEALIWAEATLMDVDGVE
jgi:hypothetical protein